MKAFTILFAVALIASIQAIEFTEEMMTHMRTSHKECAKESGLSDEEIDKVHNFPNDGDSENMRKHLVCIAKKLDYLKEDGTLDTEKIKENMQRGKVSDEKTEKILKDCTTKKSTIEETVAEYVKCKHGILGRIDLKLFT